MDTLPASPLPQTIAGIPAYFTTGVHNEGPFPPRHRRSSPRIMVRLHFTTVQGP